MIARIPMKRISGIRADPFLVRRSGAEKKKIGVQRQRIGNVLRASLMGSLEVSARAVREIPRMYPPRPTPRRIRRAVIWSPD
jgi:hypothetical protein